MKKHFQAGLVSISFRDHSPEEILFAMQQAQLTCIEWGSDVHAPYGDADALEKLVTLQEKYGITCCAYGTYFRLGVTPMEELPGYIRAAKTLGTDILRLWCGDKNSEDYTGEEKQALFSACRAAADMAKEENVTLCLECHNNTYTNRAQAALEVMQAVDSSHFRMYWQPNQRRTEEENLAYATLLSPYTRHLHVFNWRGKERFPLAQALELWQKYLACFPGDRTLLLEFMPDNDLTTLPQEATALHDLINAAAD